MRHSIRVGLGSVMRRAHWAALFGLAGAAQAGTLTDNFTTTKGTTLGGTKIDKGILKLVDLDDIKDDGLLPGGTGLQGAYFYADLDAGKRVGSFNAKFKALVGGGTERPAQGFSFVFASDIPSDAPFREGGGSTTGLTVSFDTTDSQKNPSGNTEGNDPGDAPGIILKFGGVKVGAKRFDGVRTGVHTVRNPNAFSDVEINLDPDGTIDVTMGGTKVYDNFPSGYIPIAGQFGFGAGTEERTTGTRDDHWIKDLSITTTPVTGAYISSRSPGGLGARPDAVVSFTLESLTQAAITMKFNGADVVPTVKKEGTKTTVTYDPPGLLAAGSKNSVVLTYEGSRVYSYEFNVINVPTVPASAKLAAADIDTNSSGFTMRIYQDLTTSVNSTDVAENVLRGVLGKNEANLAKFKADGTLDLGTINMVNELGNPDLEGFFPVGEIEIPGMGNSTDNFVVEFLGYLELKAGVNSFGVHSDDGFVCRIGSDPRSALATTLFNFVGTRSPSETQFSCIIPEDGIYPLRLMFFQNGGRANCEFYSIDQAENRTLVNDRAKAGHVKSYRARKTAYKHPPYVVRTAPSPGQVNVASSAKIEAIIQDFDTAFKAGSASLKVNGTAVNATVQTTGKETKVSYTPAAALSGDVKVDLAYSDGDNRSLGGSWTFKVAGAGTTCEPVGTSTPVTGYWDFKNGDLKGKVGADIKLRDNSLASHYVFGTTGQGKLAAVPGIGGKAVKVLGIPFTDDAEMERKLGLQVSHGLKPNGGGSLVNQWTMIVDLLWQDDGGKGFGTILRTSDFAANKDGDLFWRKSDGNYGKGCCSLYDSVAGQDGGSKHEDGAWARFVVVADFASEPRTFAKYVNGFLHRSDVQGDANKLDGRFSLAPEVLMFNDGDDNEQASVYISAIQFRQGALTADEVKKLGGASSDGIPTPASGGSGGGTSGVSGNWTFDNGDLKATVGKDLELRDTSLASHYVFGTTGQGKLADVPNIGGKAAKIVGIPFTDDAEMERKLGFLVSHGMAPNGGGTLVNQWTMIADVLWRDDGGKGFGTILRTSDFAANKDGDLFWRKSDGNYGKGCCSLYDSVAGQDPGAKHEDSAWARFVVVADFASEPRTFAKYVNGFLHRSDVQGDANKLDGRFSLASQVLMFNDGDDNEQASVFINGIQFRPGVMTADQVKALGGPSADGIPMPPTGGTSTSPLTGYWTFDAGDLKASHGKDITLRDNALASHYVFGTTGQGKLADVPNIGGKAAKIVGIPFTDDAEMERKLGFLVTHGVAPNGGGTLANQWTMIADLYWRDDGGKGFGTILRTSDFAANKDGDLFWRKSDGNYGKGCCSLYDSVAGQDPGAKHEDSAWARFVVVADFASEPRTFAKYVNGFLHRSDVQGDANKLDGRFSLASQVLMFNDGDDNEQASVFINSIQFRTGTLTAEQVKALGGPSADGIPLPASTGGAAPCDPGTPSVPTKLPKLTVGRSGANLDLKWDTAAGFVLEGSSDLRAWAPVQGVNGTAYSTSTPQKAFFFRLRKQ